MSSCVLPKRVDEFLEPKKEIPMDKDNKHGSTTFPTEEEESYQRTKNALNTKRFLVARPILDFACVREEIINF